MAFKRCEKHDKILPCGVCRTTAPEPMTDWQHRNGNIYGVMLITNVGSDRPEYPPTVVYVNKANGKWYSRPLADWHRSMTEVVEDDE